MRDAHGRTHAVEWLIQILNSVQYGLLLFLVASGLTLIFGIMGVINLAHGSFYMIGAYLASSLSSLTGSLWLAIPLGIVLSAALGLLLEWALISRLYRRDHLYQVLLTFGLILIFEELRSISVGDDVHSVAIPALLDGVAPADRHACRTRSTGCSFRPSASLLAGADVRDDPEDALRHDDPRRGIESAKWRPRSVSISAGSTRWCSPLASRSRPSPA